MKDKYYKINEERYINFFKKFTLEKKIICNHTRKTYDNDGSDDFICSYCGERKPNVSFDNDPHLIPQLLGNKYLISKFECDECNQLFSKYEDSLASYLGFFRSFIQLNVSSKKENPKFKNPNTGFEIYMQNEKLQIFSKSKTNEVIIDEINKSAKIKSDKFTYVPLFVYKILLKVALGLVDGEEISQYKEALKFLQSNKYYNDFEDFPIFRLFSYFVPGPFYPFPAAFLYRRNNDEKIEFPKHTLLLFFRNHLYQIFLPFCEIDKDFYTGTIEFNLPIAPIGFDLNKLPDGENYTWNNINLSSSNNKKSESYEVNVKFSDLRKE